MELAIAPRVLPSLPQSRLLIAKPIKTSSIRFPAKRGLVRLNSSSGSDFWSTAPSREEDARVVVAEKEDVTLVEKEEEVKEEVSFVEEVKEEVSFVEEVKEEVSFVEEVKEEISSVEEVKEEVSFVEEVSSVEEVKEEDSFVEEVKEEVSSVEEVKEEDSFVEEVKEEVSSVEEVKEEVSSVEEVKEEVPVDTEVKEVASTVEVSVDAEVKEVVVSSSEVSEGQSSAGDLLNQLNLNFDSEDKSKLLVYGAGALVALWISSVVISAIDSIPLFPNLMEVVGLGYTVWFSSRYLLFKDNREEFFAKIVELKDQILGSDDE